MHPLDTEEIKAKSFQLLRDFDRVCTAHGVRYSLGMGTLLGAVRHRGFIPWDDDVDVILTRPEYQKLVSLGAEAFGANRALISLETNADFTAPLAKFVDASTTLIQTDHAERVTLGLYLDLFVYDMLPPDPDAWDRHCRRGDRLQRLWTAAELKPKPGERNLLKLAYKHTAAHTDLARSLALRLRDYASQTAWGDGTHAANLMYSTFPRAQFCFTRAQLETFTELTFEGASFPAFVDYDAFLTGWYGDYLRLPPPEKRVGHHRYTVYGSAEKGDETP